MDPRRGALGQAVERLRATLAPSPCAVLDRPADLELDAWGPASPAYVALMERVKAASTPPACAAPACWRAAVSGYDDTRAPQLELIDDCVHCGFCLPTCPTYTLWGEEMDSPRGRIVLMKAGAPGGALGAAREHLDRCLGCMACVTACPSGVQYDKLIEDARAQVERNFERPPAERAHRRLVFELFTHPGRLRVLAPGAAAVRRLGLDRIARRPRVRARCAAPRARWRR